MFLNSLEGHKKAWVEAVYETEQEDYKIYGHRDEGYHEFLLVTYDATLESMGIENLDADIKGGTNE